MGSQEVFSRLHREEDHPRDLEGPTRLEWGNPEAKLRQEEDTYSKPPGRVL